MPQNSKNNFLIIKSKFLNSLICTILSSFIFFLSHPNPIFTNGCPSLAYLLLLPLLSCLYRETFWGCFIWGGIFGLLSYFFSMFWLSSFHDFALIFAIAFYFIFYAVFGVVFYLVKKNLKSSYIFVMPIIWVLFEYIKTLGFLGFPYGIMAYSQWQFLPLVQWASVFGIWGVSFVVVSCGAMLFSVFFKIKKSFSKLQIESIKELPSVIKSFTKKTFLISFRPFIVWVVCFFILVVLGRFVLMPDSVLSVKKPSQESFVISLIQPNLDPWKNGISAYESNFRTLKLLSEEAVSDLKEQTLLSDFDFSPKTSLIIWPETAFVPRIVWHYNNRLNFRSYSLVMELLSFIDSQNSSFIIGNDHGSENSVGESVEYNAALFFEPKNNVIPPQPKIYSKIKLVPFTEYFPFKKQFPHIYKFLEDHDTHFWEPGKEIVLFDFAEKKFGSLICFEDAFSLSARDAVKSGADIIVSITNDSWAHSVACQNQHLSMAVFRAVENRVPLLRAGVSGVTCGIDVNGRLEGLLEPFEKGFSNIWCKKTFNKASTILMGDSFVLFLLICFIILIIVDKTGKIGRKWS